MAGEPVTHETGGFRLGGTRVETFTGAALTLAPALLGFSSDPSDMAALNDARRRIRTSAGT